MFNRFTAVLLFSGAFAAIALVILSTWLLPNDTMLFGFTTSTAGGFTGAYFTYINSHTQDKDTTTKEQ